MMNKLNLKGEESKISAKVTMVKTKDEFLILFKRLIMNFYNKLMTFRNRITWP